MINIKALSIATDGSYKRVAITYDEIDDAGKVTKGNNKINRIVTDSDILEVISVIEKYANSVINANVD